jgi:N-acetylmuramoyl-L-alanine amidase
MKITNHRLTGRDVDFKATPNIGKPFPKGLPDTIIIHYTGAPTARSAINWLTNKAAGASAHLVIARDGKITQLANFNVITWHAGRSQWQNRDGLNNFSIGIEIDNCGILNKVNANTYRFGEKGPSFGKDEVLIARHKNGGKAEAWQRYPESQMEKVKQVCELLIAQYGIKLILGHDDIAPGRKADPGPAFPMEDFRNSLLNPQKNHPPKEQETNNTSKLGLTIQDTVLFSTPSKTAQAIHRKINSNTELQILEENADFLRVQVSVIGNVSKSHVRFDNTNSPSDGTIETNGLNFRSKPNAQAELLGLPLSKGTKFTLLENGASWILIRIEREGWIEKSHCRFL